MKWRANLNRGDKLAAWKAGAPELGPLADVHNPKETEAVLASRRRMIRATAQAVQAEFDAGGSVDPVRLAWARRELGVKA